MQRIIWIFTIGLLSNAIIIASIFILYKDKIYIECHYDKLGIIITLLTILMCLGVILFQFSKMYELNFLKSLKTTILSISLWLFSFNLYTVLKSISNIILRQDILYSNRVFTIHYLFTQEELLAYVDEFYQKNSHFGGKFLPREEKLQILDNATTMKQTRLNVEAYCNYEATTFWPKIKNLLTTSMNFLLDHPILLIGIGIGVSAIVAYLGYNIYKLREEVKEINKCTDLDYIKRQLRDIDTAKAEVVKMDVSVTKTVEGVKKLAWIIRRHLYMNKDGYSVKPKYTRKQVLDVIEELLKKLKTIFE